MKTIVCCRCRTLVKITESDFEAGIVPPGGVTNLHGAFFCSQDCYGKGVPRQVRSQIDGLLQFDPNEKPLVICGIHDAVSGFDCLSNDPEYVQAYNNGMRARRDIEAAQAAYAGVQGMTRQ